MFYQAWRNSRGEANKLGDPLWPAAESGLPRLPTSGEGRIGIARIVLPDHAISILNLFPVASTRSKQITTVRLNHANGNHEAIQKVEM